MDWLFPQAISSLSDITSPILPLPFPSSAFKILYLSPLKLKKAPGVGYRPFTFPIIFEAPSLQEIWHSNLSIFFAYVAFEWSCS